MKKFIFQCIGMIIVLAFAVYYRLIIPTGDLKFFLTGTVIILTVWPAGKEEPPFRELIQGGFFGAFILVFLVTARYLKENIVHPQEWDFLCFYLIGQAIFKGLNIYDPESYINLIKTLEIPIHVSKEFIQEFASVGSRYPPPANLLFGILGGLSFWQANLVWDGVIIFSILVCVVLTKRVKDVITYALNSAKSTKNPQIWGELISYLFAFNLILALFPAWATILNEQINFLVLACLLLFFLYSDKPIGGFWLGLGVILKPFVVICGLYFLVKKLWKSFAVMTVTGIGSILISIPIIGLLPTLQYFKGSFLRKFSHVYLDSVSQSLYSVYYKLDDRTAYHFTFLVTVLVILFALFLTTTTFYLVVFRAQKHPLFLITLLLSFSLLIFPQINSHYSLSLTLPLLVIYVLWYEKYGEKVVLAFLIIYLALSSSVFLGNFFTWVIIAMICYRSKEIKTYAQHE